eukprot:1680379-Amphidinium_carterae.1
MEITFTVASNSSASEPDTIRIQKALALQKPPPSKHTAKLTNSTTMCVCGGHYQWSIRVPTSRPKANAMQATWGHKPEECD